MKKTFFIGLSDKDTKQQKFTEVEAFKITMELVGKHFGWGTIYAWKGFYKHDDGSVVIENTLVVMTTTDLDHKAFVEEVKTILNQESVLVEIENPQTSFE